MKKILNIILAMLILLSVTVSAEEEFSESANIDYGYDESYDETEKQEDVTTSKSDDISTSYNEDYDESVNQDVTSSEYDDSHQTYNKEFDERITENTADYSQTNGITVVLNGNKIKFDVEPTLINNRTMVPMRAVFEALGAEVEWDGTTQTAIGVKKNTTVKITIGKDYLLKNNNIIVLDSPAVVISGRTLVPIRAIAESLDCKVQWYSQTQTVEILK